MKSIYLIFLGLLLNLPIGFAQLEVYELLNTNGTFNPAGLIPTGDDELLRYYGRGFSKIIKENATTTNGWQRKYSNIYNYSANCQKIISEQTCHWNSLTNADACILPLVSYQFDNQGRLIANSWRTFKYVGNRIYPDTIYEGSISSYIYTYTPQNLLATKIQQGRYKDSYTYDNLGRLSQHVEEDYDSNTNTWISPDRDFYTYNNRNQITQILNVDSDSIKTDLSYDALGRLTGFTSSGWRNNRWNLSSGYLNVISFNSKNRPLVIESLGYGTDYYRREERSYYGNDTLIQRGAVSYKRLATDPWLNFERHSFEYCGVPTVATKEVRGLDLFISPNPVTDRLLVTYTEGSIHQIQITSLTGQTLLQKTVNDKQTEIDVSQLANGLYLIVAETKDGRKSVQKFVKN